MDAVLRLDDFQIAVVVGDGNLCSDVEHMAVDAAQVFKARRGVRPVVEAGTSSLQMM